jgi:hypothetical protein
MFKTPIQIECDAMWGEISNSLDCELETQVRRALLEHNRCCARCKAVFEGTSNVVALMRDSRAFEVPDGFSQRLYRRLNVVTAMHGVDEIQ